MDRFPFAYQPEMEQGDVLDQEDVDQLSEGMTRAEVRQLLGTPVLRHPFHEHRWDYIYSIRGGSQEPTRRHLTLHFDEDERLVRIEGDRDWEGARPDTDVDGPVLPDPADEQPMPAPGGQQPPPGPQGGGQPTP